MTENEERERVTQLLEKFLDGTGELWDFDDLVQDKYSDELITASIKALDKIPRDYPASDPSHFCSEEGFQEIQKIIDGLRTRITVTRPKTP